jgi:hypothetical protein
MISNFFGRNAALLTVAFFLAITATAFGQTASRIEAKLVDQLLTTNDAGILRRHLVDHLKGKVESTTATGEKFSITGSGRSITCELVSQTVVIGREKVEQISLVYKESGVTRSLDFVQYANGDFGKLEGAQLVTYSLSANRQACLNELFGPGSNCAACKNKVNACLANNTRLFKVYACLLRNIDGTCLACGVDYYLVLGCILG